MIIIKQILYDTDTGLLWFRDSKGNKYQCSIYGDKLVQFHPKISGIASATQRKKEGSDWFTNIPSLSTKEIDYYPISNKLECYSQFPRPLVRPLSNIDYSKRNEHLRDQLVSILKQNYASDKALHLFMEGNNSQAMTSLSFSTCKLANEQKYLIDTEKILDLIKSTFDSMFFNKADWEIDIIKHQVQYKALKKLKQFLQLNNYDINVYHYGITLNSPSNKVKRLFSAVNRTINKKNLGAIKPKEKCFKRVITYRPASAMTNTHSTQLDTDLSFLSNSNNDSFKEEIEKKKIKTANRIKCITEKERKYIQGYKPPVIKQKPIIRKEKTFKLRTNLDFYLKENELQMKVNPIVARFQSEKNKYDDERLKLKQEQTVIRIRGLGFKSMKIAQNEKEE